MLTVRGLVSEMGLELTTGDAGADAPVRWVHISELPDPTPWLSGGELLLTTGFQLDSEERQREFVRLLAGHHLAGLGFGTGFDHDTVPAGIAEEAEALGFPVFEVPYELPVHRAHGEGLRAARERAVRGAPAWHRDPQAARAACARGERARRGGARTRRRHRRRGVRVLGPRRDDLLQGVPARAPRGGAGAGPPGGDPPRRGAERRRGTGVGQLRVRARPPGASPGARWCCRFHSEAAARRRPGSWRRATPAGSATSSG